MRRDFSPILVPDRGHAYGAEEYGIRFPRSGLTACFNVYAVFVEISGASQNFFMLDSNITGYGQRPFNHRERGFSDIDTDGVSLDNGNFNFALIHVPNCRRFE